MENKQHVCAPPTMSSALITIYAATMCQYIHYHTVITAILLLQDKYSNRVLTSRLHLKKPKLAVLLKILHMPTPLFSPN